MKIPDYITDLENWEKEFRFYSETNVRFSETDAFGHVNNTVAFVYFEQARLDYFKQLGMMEQWLEGEEQSMIVTADLQCNYFNQIKYGDSLRIGVKVDKIGRSSIDMHYIAKKEDQICLTGRGVMVQVDSKTGKAVPFQASMISLL
ncbi:thioesterase family protein [Bacillus sp. JCM 19041]|uniref:acyl-CoA thioesterase n=1 Tax=Bacillus sp. JCM 19041 TaxID=1460637 RepID=UPI0006CF6208